MNEREFTQTGEAPEGVLTILKQALARGDASIISDEVDDILEHDRLRLTLA
jgi:hypothetical protein